MNQVVALVSFGIISPVSSDHGLKTEARKVRPSFYTNLVAEIIACNKQKENGWQKGLEIRKALRKKDTLKMNCLISVLKLSAATCRDINQIEAEYNEHPQSGHNDRQTSCWLC